MPRTPLPRSNVALAGAALLVTLAACDAGDRTAASVAVHDSAGIRIVENPDRRPTAEAEPGWTVDPEPALRIGRVEGPEELLLHRVQGATRLSDGRVAVLNGGTSEVRVYDPEGAHLASLGGPGSGPGELMAPSQLLRLAGDTLVVWDGGRQSRSWFDADEGFVRSQTAGRDRFQGAFGPDLVTDVAGLLPDGSLLLRVRSARPPDAMGWYRALLGFARASGPDLATVDSIGWYGAREHYVVGSLERPLLRFIVFARDTHVAAGGDPMRIFIGGMRAEDGDGYQVDVYDTDGRRSEIIRHALAPRPPDDQEVARVREMERRSLEASPVSNTEEYIAEQLRTLPVPDRIPPHGELVVDAAGGLWVQEWTVSPTERRSWWVFDPEGRLLGRVQTPDGLRVIEIGEEYVLGVWRDDDGVEFVRMHRLER